mgnify:CR=1 FL=1
MSGSGLPFERTRYNPVQDVTPEEAERNERRDGARLERERALARAPWARDRQWNRSPRDLDPLHPAVIVDLLWPLWDDTKQPLHDKIVHTIVVRGD